MIRQICPHCFHPVELPDAAAGADAPCPACGKSIPVPGAYAPVVDPAAGPPPVRESAARVTPDPAAADRPPPPPGLVPPPTATSGGPGGPVTAPGPALTADRAAGVAVSPAVLGWVPAGCFALVLLLTFFTWVGMFPGGYRAYAQNAWEAAFRQLDASYFAEEVVREADLRAQMGVGWLLIPYLLGLVVLTVAAGAERAVRDPAAVPVPAVRSLWRYRFALFAGLAAGLLALLALQVRVGFGLEAAADRLADRQFEKPLAEATSTAATQRVNVQKGMVIGSYQLRTTDWLALAVAAHVVGLLAAAGKFWLDNRGPKPPPRVTVRW